ncbi:helix-turn-helix transcriptional regulator [Streptomyces sp. AS58]|uniref:helix-turn-helix transcriptional regulator n=1 Tax=Streptomyces sp. AS58 TaxID=1519489 RepID=UPI0006AF1F18|nr:WYL domain-containing protein [Streptomyces sp. AS58]
MHDASPTARALLTLELIQNSPGITAQRLAQRLEVSERAVRRYVGILREAEVPVESVRGPYGGYRVGRGHRVPPLMFSTTEALGLVMAVLESHRAAGDPKDPAGSALGKIIRVLPEPVAGPADAVRRVLARQQDMDAASPNPETTALLVQACAASRRLRLGYRSGPGRDRVMDVDPWAVVVHHGRWYLLCWSHTVDARRLLRIDRVTAADVRAETFTPPADLDPMRTLEEHMSEGWQYEVEVVIDAPAATAARWIPRRVGRLEELGPHRCRLIASTEDPDWYAHQLTAIEAPFHITGPPELQHAARSLAERLLNAAASGQSTD